jgi:hypothetical protein
MAKITPMDLVKSMSGKICEHSDISFAQRGNTLYTQKRCNPRTTPYSDAEIERQNKFKTALTNVAALTQEEITAYKTAFKNQKKYTSLRGYMIAMEYEKLA